MLFFSNQYYLSSKRSIETGYCEGFFPTAMEYVKKHYNVRDVNILPWKVYTEKDIQMQHAKVSSKRTTGIYPYTLFSTLPSFNQNYFPYFLKIENNIQYKMNIKNTSNVQF